MAHFNQDAFNDFALKYGVAGFFESPITLKSERKSNWYVNWRRPTEDANLMDILSDFVIGFVRDSGMNPDCFYGVPEGATKLGIITQYKWASSSPDFAVGSHALPMGRGKPKEHGEPKDRYFLGMPSGVTVVLEDVTTTGGSLLKTIGQLTESGVPVRLALGLTNRLELTPIPGEDLNKTVEEFREIFERATKCLYRGPMSVEDAIMKAGVQYRSLSDAKQLLPRAFRQRKPGEKIAREIEAEFRKYGIEPITLLEDD